MKMIFSFHYTLNYALKFSSKFTFTSSLVLISLSSLFSPVVSQAKCLVQPQKIEELAHKIAWKNESGETENTTVVQANARGVISNEGASAEMEYEAFVRPDKDGIFQLLPLPFFLIEMKHSRDSVYVCAYVDSQDENKTDVLIYFLRNGNIKTVIPKPLPFMSIKNFFLNALGKTPLVIAALPFQITEMLQATTMNLFADITRLGVDRARIKGRQLELYSGGDPTQFESYILKKVIQMDRQDKGVIPSMESGIDSSPNPDTEPSTNPEEPSPWPSS